MKELFEDFYISNCTNAFFTIGLTSDGELTYKLTDRETESNSVYLEHKESGIAFQFESDGYYNDLAEYNETWCTCNRDIDEFKKVYVDFIM